MHIHRLDHFTLRTDKLAETRAFFEAVAGLVAGPRSAFGFAGVWLYAGDNAILHLAALDRDDQALLRYLGEHHGSQGSGCVDHVALRCSNLQAFEARLQQLKVPYSPRTLPELREHQVFVTDPNGIRIEFIFDSDERASWTTDVSGVAALKPSAVAA